MDPNNQLVLEDFVRALEQVTNLLKKENPDCIIAPMFGAIPFVDIANIIDDDFPNRKVEYISASNKVYRLRDVLRGTFDNLIRTYAPYGGSFVSIDEVVSGNSLVRVYKQFEAAKMDYVNKKVREIFGDNVDFTKQVVQKFRNDLLSKINYKSIGIEDSKLRRKGKPKNDSYVKLVEEKTVIPVETMQIVTMDRSGFFPAKYKTQRDAEGKIVYLPVVDNFAISAEYIDLLNAVAEILGKPKEDVTVRNMGKIRESYRLVPEELRRF